MSAPRLLSPTTTSGGTPVGGSGTGNTIPRWSGAGASSTLTDSGLIDDGTQVYTTTRSVAIGNASAANMKLRVVGGTSGNWTGQFASSGTSGNSYGLLVDAGSTSGDVAFQVRDKSQASTYLYVRGDGNVGVGTPSPNAKFQVLQSGATEIRTTTSSNSAGNTITHRFSSSAAAGAYEGGGAYVRAIQGGGVDVWSLAFGVANASATSSEAARIDGTGNVGIGTPSPTDSGNWSAGRVLDVRSGSAGVSSVAYFGDSTRGTNMQIGFYGSGYGFVGTVTSHALSLRTGNVERAQIDANGNIYGTSGTTGMTNGFFYIPAAAGAPTGTPTAVSGRVPMYYDTTNNNFYVYNGAWKKVLLA